MLTQRSRHARRVSSNRGTIMDHNFWLIVLILFIGAAIGVGVVFLVVAAIAALGD